MSSWRSWCWWCSDRSVVAVIAAAMVVVVVVETLMMTRIIFSRLVGFMHHTPENRINPKALTGSASQTLTSSAQNRTTESLGPRKLLCLSQT